jgi:transposase
MNDAPPLSGGASDPHDPAMAICVQRLEDTCQRIEALLTRIDDRLRKVEIDVAETRGRIAQLPSTWAMITTMPGGQVAFAAAILAISKIAGSH